MTIEARKNLHRVGTPFLVSSLGRMRVYIDGKERMYSHYIWFLNTGHWPIFSKEVIHHIDGDTTNDAFKNLQLMSDFEHRSLHQMGEKNHRWKGDNASANAKRLRHYKYPDKYPPLTEGEREEYNAYRRERYKARTSTL